MKRVLRLTAIVFGIGLIGMVGMLEMIRHEQEVGPMVLFIGKQPGPATTGVYLAPTNPSFRHRILPPYFYYEALTWSPDGQWLYGIAYRTLADYQNCQSTVWRISRDVQHIEIMDGPISPFSNDAFEISPDGQWAFFVEFESSDQLNLIQMRANDGRYRRNLTADHALKLGYPVRLRVSADNQWVYVWSDTQNYRVSVDGGHVENVIAYRDPARLIASTAEWLLFAADQSVYLTDPDGQNLHLVFPEDNTIPESYVDDVVWVQQRDWLVVETYSGGEPTLQAYTVPEGRLAWRYPNLTLARVIQRGGWVLASDIGGGLRAIGGNGDNVVRMVLEHDEYSYLPFFDGLPLFMRAIPNAADAYTLWELFPDGTTRKVYEPMSPLMGLQVISSDGEWAAFYGNYATRNSVLLLKLDWTRAYQLRDAYVLDWLPPIDRAWSPIGLLVMGSVLMLGGIMLRGGRRKI